MRGASSCRVNVGRIELSNLVARRSFIGKLKDDKRDSIETPQTSLVARSRRGMLAVRIPFCDEEDGLKSAIIIV